MNQFRYVSTRERIHAYTLVVEPGRARWQDRCHYAHPATNVARLARASRHRQVSGCYDFVNSVRKGSSNMRALRLDIYRIQGTASGHEQSISFGTTETNVPANLGQFDVTNPCPVWRKYLYAVVAVTDPT